MCSNLYHLRQETQRGVRKNFHWLEKENAKSESGNEQEETRFETELTFHDTLLIKFNELIEVNN